ncbi:hypothetical protein C8F04DRAFT_1128140 [Mycena alexandri]|uniref:Uncharacterized protein n=1 Tax=Mycena alexandri TaxID=1745969 RepID=A0AAD6SCR2_9AGAR|nr:hypothetical protein C8F04DRAFT_1128140 [Mycena alexandri]
MRIRRNCACTCTRTRTLGTEASTEMSGSVLCIVFVPPRRPPFFIPLASSFRYRTLYHLSRYPFLFFFYLPLRIHPTPTPTPCSLPHSPRTPAVLRPRSRITPSARPLPLRPPRRLLCPFPFRLRLRLRTSPFHPVPLYGCTALLLLRSLLTRPRTPASACLRSVQVLPSPLYPPSARVRVRVRVQVQVQVQSRARPRRPNRQRGRGARRTFAKSRRIRAPRKRSGRGWTGPSARRRGRGTLPATVEMRQGVENGCRFRAKTRLRCRRLQRHRHPQCPGRPPRQALRMGMRAVLAMDTTTPALPPAR